jgi:hypothetical protein
MVKIVKNKESRSGGLLAFVDPTCQANFVFLLKPSCRVIWEAFNHPISYVRMGKLVIRPLAEQPHGISAAWPLHRHMAGNAENQNGSSPSISTGAPGVWFGWRVCPNNDLLVVVDGGKANCLF